MISYISRDDFVQLLILDISLAQKHQRIKTDRPLWFFNITDKGLLDVLNCCQVIEHKIRIHVIE